MLWQRTQHVQAIEVSGAAIASHRGYIGSRIKDDGVILGSRITLRFCDQHPGLAGRKEPHRYYSKAQSNGKA